jgi:hypothetical protein
MLPGFRPTFCPEKLTSRLDLDPDLDLAGRGAACSDSLPDECGETGFSGCWRYC